ncbi:hypothetical protein Dimus_034345 [Dionaea muscipula]
MEYPFGHHHRSHHRRDDDDDDEYPPPPPPSRPSTDPYFRPPSSYDPSPYDQPPPPAPHNYGSYYEPPPPPPHDNYGSYYEPPPPPHQRRPTEVTGVYHSSYASDESPNYPPPSSYPQHTSPAPHVEEQEHHHSYRPHVPSFIQTHIHTGHVHENPGSEIASKPSVRVYSKAETNHSLAIRDGQVILARSDPNDLSQHWVKDEKYSIRVKDEEGFPCFALVNKATGQAMKHSVGATYPVQLITYNPDVLDEVKISDGRLFHTDVGVMDFGM